MQFWGKAMNSFGEKSHENTSALISESLSALKDSLAAGNISASDAALQAIRLGRMFFSQTRLAPLTRELLGYSQDETDSELELISLIEEEQIGSRARKCVASYRMINGFRLPLFVTLRQAREGKAIASVTREQRFCALTAMEIEMLGAEMDGTNAPYVVLDDSDDGAGVFVCRSRDFRAMQKGLSGLIVNLIDCMIDELQRSTQ